ncbi:uncharacterized protein LODBEIA_P37470 [Lodderomyces beijingensis]|uniref:Glutamine amidotransferase type-2 domain-containing protein n=1 Tax=Lodderomyces beijingensis TaxID=1775926 RepID=A0ABP0ZN02_9ASCO
MCGILLRVSKPHLGKPLCIPDLHTVGNCKVWETTDSDTIKKFLQHGEKIQPLTPRQLVKLNSLDKLRELTKQLARIKNNVKISLEDKEQQVHDVQRQIDAISREDEVEMTKDNDDDDDDDDMDSLIYKTSNRGPDCLNYTQFDLDNNYTFQSFSAILSLRQPFTKQPIMEDQFVLQFNGELYNRECLHSNDTQFITTLLDTNIQRFDRRKAVLTTLNQLQGEWAIILVDLKEKIVYFGRDRVGKRSLCFELRDGDGQLTISSNSTVRSQECRNAVYEYSLCLETMTIHKSDSVLPDPIFADTNVNKETILDELYNRLKLSAKIRQESIHPLKSTYAPNESAMAVLFSGGLDCTIIARLICELISDGHTGLDLLTVGFDNPRTSQAPDSSPDRKLATKSWFHLCKMFPQLQINLVEINVDYQNWLMHKSRVRELMYPCNTEMDLSIAIAFYFAASNLPELTTMKQLVNHDVAWEQFAQTPHAYIQETQNYISNSKVLFSGLGADELFAGYSRHEGIFNTINELNYHDLARSLIHDIQVIHERNLGRDDRVMSCWGKELRYPYLDEIFIDWTISTVPANLKFKYSMTKDKRGKDRIVPIRKYILRELAEKKLNMPWVAHELKRAIQFGAKSAKLEIGQSKSKGNDSLS